MATEYPEGRRSSRSTAGNKLQLLLEAEKADSLPATPASGAKPGLASTPRRKLLLETEIEQLQGEIQCLHLEHKLATLQEEKSRLIHPPSLTLNAQPASATGRRIVPNDGSTPGPKSATVETILTPKPQGGQGNHLTLWSKVQYYVGRAWAETTKKTYQTHMRTYFDFCENMHQDPVPASPDRVKLYIVYLADIKKLKFHSIKCYVNIISVLHKASNLPDPTKCDWELSQLWSGLKRELGSGQDCIQPITPVLLLHLRDQLNLTLDQDKLFWSACLTAFFGLLRPSNFLVKGIFNPDKHLRRLDAVPCTWGYLLQLRWTKTIQYRERSLYVTLPKLPDHPLCPATALQNVLRIENCDISSFQSVLDPLFATPGTSVLTYRAFTDKLKVLIASTGLDPANYSGHSFRRGGASWARLIGCSDDEIQTLGDWSSEAFKRYYDDNVSRRLNIALKFGKLLPLSS